jgi:hypothetical protein
MDSPLLSEWPSIHPEAHIVARDKDDFRVWVIVLFVPLDVGHVQVVTCVSILVRRAER